MKKLILLGLSATFIMVGCADTATDETVTDTDEEVTETDEAVTETETDVDEEEAEQDDMMMDMDHDGDIPEGLQEAENPTYPEGSTVIITASHMPGMEGAEATISGAFDTTIYEVSFTPTTGGERVMDHRWVIQEDLEEGSDVAEAGDEVTLDADHMEGMQGATAVVEEAITGTVYAVDYNSTVDGERVTNHMWVTEDELEAAE